MNLFFIFTIYVKPAMESPRLLIQDLSTLQN